jgi:hypothetical protein
MDILWKTFSLSSAWSDGSAKQTKKPAQIRALLPLSTLKLQGGMIALRGIRPQPGELVDRYGEVFVEGNLDADAPRVHKPLLL